MRTCYQSAVLAVVLLAFPALASAPSVNPQTAGLLSKAVTRYVGKETDYDKLIAQHARALAEGKELSANDRRRYSNAYVYSGYVLYSRSDASGAVCHS